MGKAHALPKGIPTANLPACVRGSTINIVGSFNSLSPFSLVTTYIIWRVCLSTNHFILFLNIFIYLATPGLSCSTWDLVPGTEPRPPAMTVQVVAHGLLSTRFLCPQNSPGKNTGADCHFLLQGLFLTQWLNLGVLYCREILYGLSHQGSRYIFPH